MRFQLIRGKHHEDGQVIEAGKFFSSTIEWHKLHPNRFRLIPDNVVEEPAEQEVVVEKKPRRRKTDEATVE